MLPILEDNSDSVVEAITQPFFLLEKLELVDKNGLRGDIVFFLTGSFVSWNRAWIGPWKNIGKLSVFTGFFVNAVVSSFMTTIELDVVLRFLRANTVLSFVDSEQRWLLKRIVFLTHLYQLAFALAISFVCSDFHFLL
jgi:hypothetical protein